MDASPTASEMADSGLETGSISPHENTTYSENFSTDLEVTPAATEYTSANDDDSDRIRAERGRNKSGRKTLLLYDERREALNNDDFCGKNATQSESNNRSTTCSSLETEHPPANTSDSAQEAKLNAEEVFQYESQMLSEPFYESDCGSDENESFEFIEPVPSASGDYEEKCFAKCKLQRKIQSDAEESESTTVETESDHSRPIDSTTTTTTTGRNSSSTSGYYFIDASTLNDEVDIVSTNVTKNQYGNNNTPYFAFSSNYVDYTSSDKSNNPVEEQSYKFTPLKTLTLQTGHERVAEFERELKLTEYLQPLPESRKVRRVDSASEEKADGNKPTEKESLAVEIKEADSGESAHPSPCPDNNTRLSNDEKTEASSNAEATENENAKDAIANEDRRPSLIRRNTFELDSNDEKLSVLRQEYERRQGNLIFQSAIPQYSGHRVDDDSICHAPSDSVVSVEVTEPSITFTPDVQMATNTHPVIYNLVDSCEYNQKEAPQKSHLQSNFNRSCTIYPVIKSASDKSILDCATDSDDAVSNHCSSSLPVTLNSILEKSTRLEPIKKTKRGDEATPIISGGVSSSDYSFKPTDSPTVRRKTESTPIVSGGSVIMNKPEVKTRSSRMSSSMTAWVVDMSDCSKQESGSRNNSRNMSQSFSTSECIKKPVQKSINCEKQGSLGFFVNLKDVNDIEPTKSHDHSVERKRRDSKPYCEFYVDISDKNNDTKVKPSERRDGSIKNDTSKESEKKNIFPMFINLNDTHDESDRNITVSTHRRSFSTIPTKSMDTKTDDSSSRDNSSVAGNNQPPDNQEPKRETKPSVFMFIESDSPVVRRRTLSTSRPTFKRHSWNMDKTQSANGNGNGNSSGNGCVAKELMFRKEHKRAHSISMDGRSISKRSSQAKTSSSSHSLSDAAKADFRNYKDSKTLQDRENNSNNMDTSSEDVFEFDVRDTPPNSHVEIENEEQLRSNVNQRGCEYKDIISGRAENLEVNETKGYEDEFSETSAWEKTCTESTEGQTRKSETFDISSGSSEPSPDSDNHDYELNDLLNGEISGVNDRPQIITAGNSSKISETRKSLSETIKKIECELKEPEYNNVKRQMYDCRSSKKDGKAAGRNSKNLHSDSDKTSSSGFVRLSDLDRTPIVNHDASEVKDDRDTQYRMSSSIPETSWIESKLAITRNSGPIRPVSRKLASVMSTSLPSKQKSPLEDFAAGDGEGEGIISESDLSSMQSSMGRSGAGTSYITQNFILMAYRFAI